MKTQSTPKNARRIIVWRILEIHKEIFSGSYPNCTTLAELLECSEVAVKGDIDFMREQLGWDIQFDPKKNGYYYGKDPDLFGLPITEGDLILLITAYMSLNQSIGTPDKKPFQAFFDKLSPFLGRSSLAAAENIDRYISFRPFAPEKIDPQTFQALLDAARNGRSVKFTYRNRWQTEKIRRHIDPYHLTCVNGQWYVIGYCHKREALRTFLIKRVKWLETTQETFKRPKTFNINKELKYCFGIMSGTGKYKVHLRFNPRAHDLVEDRDWRKGWKFKENPDGTADLRMRLGNLEEVTQWVLGFGPDVKVLGPDELIEKVAQASTATAAQYVKSKLRVEG